MNLARKLSSLIIACASLMGQAEPVLNDARFTDLMARLAPDPKSRWRSIPWRIDLLAARNEAAIANKPLFVWAMDGHPLGCT